MQRVVLAAGAAVVGVVIAVPCDPSNARLEPATQPPLSVITVDSSPQKTSSSSILTSPAIAAAPSSVRISLVLIPIAIPRLYSSLQLTLATPPPSSQLDHASTMHRASARLGLTPLPLAIPATTQPNLPSRVVL